MRLFGPRRPQDGAALFVSRRFRYTAAVHADAAARFALAGC
jgi:hypothetical protein